VSRLWGKLLLWWNRTTNMFKLVWLGLKRLPLWYWWLGTCISLTWI